MNKRTNKYKTIFFVFGCWILSEKLAFARKITGLPDSGGWSPSGSYSYG